MSGPSARRTSFLRRKVAIKEELRDLRRRTQLSRYQPYPKQYAFHSAGETFAPRAFLSANQVGKTFGASMEVAMHATGEYPDWWDGIRYERPVTIWTGSPTNESSRDVIQKALLGTESTSMKHPDMGTGSIPFDNIKGPLLKRQAGVQDVVDQIKVKSRYGNSIISLKTFDQGRAKWQGRKVDFVWLDEEPQETGLYGEAFTRRQAVKDVDGVHDGRLIITLTPLLGSTDIVNRFRTPAQGDIPHSMVNMTIYDCIGGVWPEGTPWAGAEWKGHYTKESADETVAGYPEHERETRAYGIPMMGEGRVYPFSEQDLKFDLFEFPKHWPRICGVDFGIGHPAAGVWLAWDRESDVVYVYDCYRMPGKVALYHAHAIKSRGDWIPVAWPHDGLKRDPGSESGARLKDQYRLHGANMMRDSAREPGDKGGSQSIESTTMKIHERMETGRFKVASHLSDWFEEFRNYHRKDGLIVAIREDIMAATRIAVMELRHARTQPVPVIRRRVQQEAYISGF